MILVDGWEIGFLDFYEISHIRSLNKNSSTQEAYRITGKTDNTFDIILFFPTHSRSYHDDVTSFWVANMDREFSEGGTDCLSKIFCRYGEVLTVECKGISCIEIWEFIYENILSAMVAIRHRNTIDTERSDENGPYNDNYDKYHYKISDKEEKLTKILFFDDGFRALISYWLCRSFFDFFWINKHGWIRMKVKTITESKNRITFYCISLNVIHGMRNVICRDTIQSMKERKIGSRGENKDGSRKVWIEYGRAILLRSLYFLSMTLLIFFTTSTGTWLISSDRFDSRSRWLRRRIIYM